MARLQQAVPALLASHVGTDLCLSCFSLLANVPGKSAENGPKYLDPAAHMGDPENILSSWLWIGPALFMGSECVEGNFQINK